jgi:NAD-dependent SIR2 family protein deacetylase
VTVEAPRAVRCGSCGDSFDLSARNVRATRKRGEEPVCALCRRKPQPVDPAMAARLRRWWTDRYSREELEEIAGWIWPDLVPNPCPNASNGAR